MQPGRDSAPPPAAPTPGHPPRLPDKAASSHTAASSPGPRRCRRRAPRGGAVHSAEDAAISPGCAGKLSAGRQSRPCEPTLQTQQSQTHTGCRAWGRVGVADARKCPEAEREGPIGEGRAGPRPGGTNPRETGRGLGAGVQGPRGRSCVPARAPARLPRARRVRATPGLVIISGGKGN